MFDVVLPQGIAIGVGTPIVWVVGRNISRRRYTAVMRKSKSSYSHRLRLNG